jgi:hypothetical protein
MKPVAYHWWDLPNGTEHVSLCKDAPRGMTVRGLYFEEDLCACKKTMAKTDVSSRKCCHQYYDDTHDDIAIPKS